MNRHKGKIAAMAILLFFFAACKKEEKFAEPGIILNKWSAAAETFDYESYKKCEAYPLEKDVFHEKFKDVYFSKINVTKIEDLREKDIKTDFAGDSFIKRNVFFECVEIDRATKKEVQLVKGEVFFIKFKGSRADEGWLMSNKTIVRF
ncbi:MAG: hypothetical protein LBT84_03495 [Spirochaetia bacterium]|jgi:hypothetical protein|nr:hypothetical protein [Spirochaetia bacterium]